MKKMLHSYKEFWNEAETPLEYILTFCVTVLGFMAFTGIGKMLFEIITNPSQFNGTTYGIFDTLG